MFKTLDLKFEENNNVKAGEYNLKLVGTFADTNANAEYPFKIIIEDPCTTPSPTINSPTLPDTSVSPLEYFIKTDDPL